MLSWLHQRLTIFVSVPCCSRVTPLVCCMINQPLVDVHNTVIAVAGAASQDVCIDRWRYGMCKQSAESE